MGSQSTYENRVVIYTEYMGTDEHGNPIIHQFTVIQDEGCDLWEISCQTCPYPICAKHDGNGQWSVDAWMKRGINTNTKFRKGAK